MTDQSTMKVTFAAFHQQNGWRTHTRHDSVEAALTGRRGAVVLLRNGSPKAEQINARDGQALAVFVWADDAGLATGLRFNANLNAIESTHVPVHLLTEFRNGDHPPASAIKQWFAGAGIWTASQYATDVNHEAKQGTSDVEKIVNRRGRRYRYGEKPTWEVVYEAVREFEEPVATVDLGRHIRDQIPDFNLQNLGPDLSVLSVNCNSRGHHSANRLPRWTDTGNPYDKLIRLGKGRQVRFAIYDPAVHGVWALVDVGDKILRPRFCASNDTRELEQARATIADEGLFDPSEDARRRVMAAIVQREGQPAFRKRLLDAYGSVCAITGCRVSSLLEAAHIVPYRGPQTNQVSNGLPLRADLHKLFDLHLFSIDPDTLTVHLSKFLKGSEYAVFDGVVLKPPSSVSMPEMREALRHHAARCSWVHASSSGAPLDE